jgi:hypothetical protein
LFESFLDLLSNSGSCIDMYNPNHTTRCNCMAELDFANEEEQEAVFNYLSKYAIMPWCEKRNLVLEWKRCASAFRSSFMENRNRVYLLPGSSTYKICKNALARIIGKERHAWDSIQEGKEEHGLAKREAGNRGQSSEIIEKLHEYFQRLQELGQPRATKIVTNLANNVIKTDLKYVDTDLVELPACQSKRALYRSFVNELGWSVSFDNKSRKVSEVQVNNSMVEEELSGPISWPTFCRFWKKHYPKIVNQKPSEDLCDDCVVFANKHKYNSGFLLQDDEGEEQECKKDIDYDALEKKTEEREQLIIDASKHVEMARSQRLLFVTKKEDAKATKDDPQDK